jgi:UDP-N-acetylmuramate--alanine ligase
MLMDQSRTRVEEWNVQERTFNLTSGMHVHLVGLAGSGISAIAWLLLDRGFTVSGSDLQSSSTTSALAQAGATVYEGHAAENIQGADVVVISSAIPQSNPELGAARTAGIPVLKRADFLGHLMADQLGIAVAGTHGKTTTTSMIAHILLETGHDPSFIVGGVLPTLNRNGRAGDSRLFVVEADEYDYMFLGLRPQIEIITNVEHDHPDLFATAEAYREAFLRFVQRLPQGGRLVLCADDAGTMTLREQLDRDDLTVLTYGISGDVAALDYAAVDVQPNQLGGSDFVALEKGATLGVFRLRVPGAHNVRNALAAIAVCRALDVPFAGLMEALASFGGVGRRFQVVGSVRDVTIIDDYAHHPTEIRVTLAAARQQYPGRRLWAVWQPHTYSRTRLLLQEFAACFDDADRVLVLDVFRSRERETLGVDSAQVVAEMEHPGAIHIGDRQEAAQHILDRVRPGDVILTLGAGDGDQVGRWVLEGLQRRNARNAGQL